MKTRNLTDHQCITPCMLYSKNLDVYQPSYLIFIDMNKTQRNMTIFTTQNGKVCRLPWI